MQKRCEKRFCDHIKAVVCEKSPKKTSNIRKMRAFSKWPRLALTPRLQPLQNGQFGSKIKNLRKVRKKRFSDHIRVIVCKKKTLQKTPQYFEKSQNWPRRKGYSLCKMVNQGQKIKMQKKVRKTILRPHQSCCVRKTAPKNT